MIENLTASILFITNQTKANIYYLEVISLIMLGAYFLTQLSGRRLLYLGIVPRHWAGLLGIIFAPFLHAHFNHLFFNLIPLLVLSNFILFNGLVYFIKIIITIGFLSGLLTWSFGRPALHIGASGVVTGLWGLLITQVYTQPSLTTIILAILCAYYFAGIFLGIFPSQKGVSWEGHLFGLIAGVATGLLKI